MWVGDVDLREAMVKRPCMADRSSTVRHDNHRALAAEEINKELKECINCKGLLGGKYSRKTIVNVEPAS